MYLRITHRVGIAFGAACLAMAGIGVAAPAPAEASGRVAGIDVARHQSNVDWRKVARSGIRFAYVKATEGSDYTDPEFRSHYTNAKAAGLYVGAYHFARPNTSPASQQANRFLDIVGYRADGKQLPPVLDIEYNPGAGGSCYGRTPAELKSWIRDFVTVVKRRTGRDAVIYTSPSFWRRCLGDSHAFKNTNPLWIAHYEVSRPSLPGGWRTWTFWQYTDQGRVPGIAGPVDRNHFNGDEQRLKRFATG
ncbi:hypothetical protein TH66_17560 [Carbonactinospora thermoautotrophica]|uniref:lysozyme n=1 Tax=Carbonactinospora thermoautotrophica TaxID=1469144 RepID=A0A132MLI0_9ACTN|nr:GH25 family lysozyme [Carbonactinospora thermoautotrophica]KWW97455.1 hypothetical protein TH66_17560 [Carbonactinospora thermoautotrophica]KWW98720.1 Glycoside hydrolase family 25 [Carbonactinospora thermoautotrophica]KWX09417.1 hypothetical protein TR74_09705 [Carbonactinospora thermoautotrophica]